MTTIGHFEQALGRVALWSSHRDEGRTTTYDEQFVPRLRIYPHALRDRNAYYSPAKKALLFGYFPVGIKDANNTPGHARLHLPVARHHRPRDDARAARRRAPALQRAGERGRAGVPRGVRRHRRAVPALLLPRRAARPDRPHPRRPGEREPARPARPAVRQGVRPRRRAARLRWARSNRRPASGSRTSPTSARSSATPEPHARGAILVAAVFGAFLKVYRARTADLYRIASEGTGVLPRGRDPPGPRQPAGRRGRALRQQTCCRCASARSTTARRSTSPSATTCAAIVTADVDFNPDDPAGYRLAFVESFRQWGIHPGGMRSMSVESLLWPTGEAWRGGSSGRDRQRGHCGRCSPRRSRRPRTSPSKAGHARPQPNANQFRPWNLESDRYETWKGVDANAAVLWSWLMKGKGQAGRRRSASCSTSDNRRRRCSAQPDLPGHGRRRGPLGAQRDPPQPRGAR